MAHTVAMAAVAPGAPRAGTGTEVIIHISNSGHVVELGQGTHFFRLVYPVDVVR